MKGVTERQLNDYLRLRDTRLNNRFLAGRVFRGTIQTVQQISPALYLVQIIRNGDTVMDPTRFFCSLPGYMPYVGDVIDLLYRTRDEAMVLAVVQPTQPGFPTLGFAGPIIVNQAVFTALTDLTGLSVTVNVGVGRRIEIQGNGFFSSSVANDSVAMFIREGNLTIQSWTISSVGPINFTNSAFPSVIFSPTPGVHTYKLSAQRTNGTGNISGPGPDSTHPAYLIVRDIGT